MKYIIIILAIFSIIVISADASEECISWEWRQTGFHTECSGWYCWTVSEYSFVCTEYAQETPKEEPIIIMPETPREPEQKPTSIGFAYIFGNSDVERYQIQKNISDMRAIYIMENIAWSNGLTPKEFEIKYKIIN